VLLTIKHLRDSNFTAILKEPKSLWLCPRQPWLDKASLDLPIENLCLRVICSSLYGMKNTQTMNLAS